MNHSLAGHYARALFELAREEKKEDEYLEELKLISNSLLDNPDFSSFLSSRQVPISKKNELIDKVFASSLSKAVLGFLHIVTENHLTKEFPLIFKEYEHLYHLEKGMIEGRVYAPFELSEKQIKDLEEIFAKETGKKVVLHSLIDKRVIGGMKIYLGDRLIDYSIDTKIDTIKNKLLYKEA